MPVAAAEIAALEARIRQLDEERERLVRRARDLRAQAASGLPERAPEVPAPPREPMSPREKLDLFRSLFRGRLDVYPKRWEKGERKGYSPACFNEFVRIDQTCKKILKPPARKSCGDCPNQAFKPVTDEALREHFRGNHVMGVYPLQPDERCWFLAADFDKSRWQQDVAAFVETCRSFDLHPAVERSRFGNGAHVWFFFAAPVPAAIARRMGCWLLTETMARRHELSMDSYDRLFPNQDTMPKGGFGNLIALPFQDGPRKRGNSVFVDDRFEPYADQWAWLASLPRLDPARVEALAAAAVRSGQVLGVQLAVPDDPDERAPWQRAPSRRPRPVVVPGPLPPRVRCVLGQGVFVEKEGLPSPVLNQIKRLAAFQNPEFYKRQAMRLHTGGTPRVITCAEEEAVHIGLPRGLLDEVRELLASHAVDVEVQDERERGADLPVRFVGDLREEQAAAVAAVLEHDVGLLVARPGTGKTVMAAAVVAARGRATLILVHTKVLLAQWVDRLVAFLDVERSAIGVIGGGKDRPSGRLDVATIQSLVDRDGVDDRVGA